MVTGVAVAALGASALIGELRWSPEKREQDRLTRLLWHTARRLPVGYTLQDPLTLTLALRPAHTCHLVSRSAAPRTCRGRYHTDRQPVTSQRTTRCPGTGLTGRDYWARTRGRGMGDEPGPGVMRG